MPYPQCERFDPDATVPVVYSCMTVPFPFNPNHHPYQIGCGLHCYACGADSPWPGERGVSIFGRRWLRPSDTRESRDGHGRYHFVASGDPRVVSFWAQPSSHFHLADVWQQFAFGVHELGAATYEYFQHPDGRPYTLCDGEAGENNESCTPGPAYLLTDKLLVTCWAFTGWGWPPYSMECTGAWSDNGPRKIWLRTEGLYNAAVAGLGSNEGVASPNSCSSNAAVTCWGHETGPSPNAPDCAAGAIFDDYYSPYYAAFDFFYVTEFTARFAGTAPENELHNAVLAFIESDIYAGFNGAMNLDQLDSNRRYAAPDENLNAFMAWFGRSYNVQADDVHAWAALPVVATLTGRLRRTGYPVSGELVIAGAHLQAHVVAQRISTFNPFTAAGDHDAVYPLIRVECVVQLAVRGDVAGFGTDKAIVQTWRPLAERDPDVPIVMQDGDLEYHLPRIIRPDTGAVADEIDWLWEGCPVRITPQFTWRGHLGHLSSKLAPGVGGPTRDVFRHDGPDSHCCNLVNGWNNSSVGRNGVGVYGMASHPDAAQYEQHNIYLGCVRLKFSGMGC